VFTASPLLFFYLFAMYVAIRPWLRNPFKSVHALALANCAEMATGLVGVTAIEVYRGGPFIRRCSAD
jgi:hypothetical protein